MEMRTLTLQVPELVYNFVTEVAEETDVAQTCLATFIFKEGLNVLLDKAKKASLEKEVEKNG